ncbi:MAG TPA: hypothetical protein PK079_15925 [Leptospiraceae bacterium]|nr:hypothetical protein [Leptospiraceae bacterium]HMX33118.1 hypothetical protein [Leptospiraceae bacterium]HMZ63067.1 hypothetical protein [Leptospiraceae bacterium]HNA09471.1 hypothetical protein [Leptospiraceae bacterium]HNC57713.1 hypothetical protein [Leptospiraceae bacterium]
MQKAKINRFQWIAVFFLSFFFGCEHFLNFVLKDEELVQVPELVGRWSAYEKGKETAVLKIEDFGKNHEYLLTVEKENKGALLRITQIKNIYVGEYHDFDEKNQVKPVGYFFILKKVNHDFQIFIGSDITKKMVDQYKLVAKENQILGKKYITYSLSGTDLQNRYALELLLSDPDFFHLKNSYNMILKRNSIQRL